MDSSEVVIRPGPVSGRMTFRKAVTVHLGCLVDLHGDALEIGDHDPDDEGNVDQQMAED